MHRTRNLGFAVCVIHELGAGDDSDKNYEQFHNIFGAPEP